VSQSACPRRICRDRRLLKSNRRAWSAPKQAGKPYAPSVLGDTLPLHRYRWMTGLQPLIEAALVFPHGLVSGCLPPVSPLQRVSIVLLAEDQVDRSV